MRFGKYKIMAFSAVFAAFISIAVYGFCANTRLSCKNSLPHISGVEHGAELNSKIGEYYGEINAFLTTANADGAQAQVQYYLTEECGVFVINSYIELGGKKAVTLPDVRFNKKGECTLPAVPNVNALASAEYLKSYAELCAQGVELCFESYGEAVYLSDLKGIMCESSRGLCGGDTKAVSVLNKAGNKTVTCATFNELCDITASLSCGLYDNYYGIGAESTDGIFAAKITDMYANMCSYCLKTEKPESVSLEYLNENSELKRSQIAALFVNVYEHFTGTVCGEESELLDTESEACRRAVGSGLLLPMLCDGYFEPQYVPTKSEFVYYAAQLAKCIFNALGGDDNLKYEQAVICVNEWKNSFCGLSVCNSEKITVNNTKSYSWYVNQNDGSRYAAVNCMPSIACMAVKWCNKSASVTPQSIRALYPQSTGGWWMRQVAETLERYGVSYRYRAISEQNIISDLNGGKIILTQMSEGDLRRSGHCMVIYGYEKRGGSLYFIVNDSDKGEAIRLSGNYCIYIMDRFVNDYIAVEGLKND